MAERRVFGIDLGTTYSCIAYVDEYGQPSVIPNGLSQPTTPSVVYFEGPDQVVVGETAKDAASMSGDRVVSTVKRVMGDEHWRFQCDGKEYTPQEISAHILRKLAADAEMQTGIPATEVVITCPAYFGFNERAATEQAGKIANLDVLQIIPEPTAAAFAYGVRMEEEQTILVYDLGGGTFDITMLEIGASGIRQVCVGGDHKLGGTNWDAEIVAWFAECFVDEFGGSVDELLDDRETYQDLLFKAERAKIALTARTAVPQQIVIGADILNVELTRERFEELTAGHLDRTLTLTDELLEEGRQLGRDKVDKLLLVGGSTFMPQVKAAVEGRFPFEIVTFRPNQAVAEGAALIGHKLLIDQEMERTIAKLWEGKKEAEELSEQEKEQVREEMGPEFALPDTLSRLPDMDVSNVSPRSFGVVVVAEDGTDMGTNMILKNDPLPKSATQTFRTYAEGQEGVSIRCLENLQTIGPEGNFAFDENEMIGTAELLFTRKLPKGSPVELTFHLTPDGLLRLHGKDLTTNQEIEAEFQTASVMSAEEEEKAKRKAMVLQVSD